MVKALITGAQGALGQALTKLLYSHKDYDVIATSRVAVGDAGLSLDVCDKTQLTNIINRTKPAIIFHLSASFSNDFDLAYAVNVESSRQILELLAVSKMPTRLVLIGSAAEYGYVRSDQNPIKESHALNPVSVYGLSKAWQTSLIGVYNAREIDVVAARIFNLFGPGISDKLFAGRVQHQINEVLKGRQETISVGPLSSVRDYLSINSAAEQILAIAKFAEGGSIHHVASGQPVSMHTMLERFLDEHNLNKDIVQHAQDMTSHTGHNTQMIYADISKTQALMKSRQDNGKV